MVCGFCDSQEIHERKIVENEFALAFPTRIPITVGHTLIIPKRCVSIFDELTLDEKRSLFSLVTDIKKALQKTYGAQGFNIAWNENKVAGQNVSHFHIHIVPRKENDEGIYAYDPRKFLYRPGSREETPFSELIAVADEIRENI